MRLQGCRGCRGGVGLRHLHLCQERHWENLGFGWVQQNSDISLPAVDMGQSVQHLLQALNPGANFGAPLPTHSATFSDMDLAPKRCKSKGLHQLHSRASFKPCTALILPLATRMRETRGIFVSPSTWLTSPHGHSHLCLLIDLVLQSGGFAARRSTSANTS